MSSRKNLYFHIKSAVDMATARTAARQFAPLKLYNWGLVLCLYKSYFYYFLFFFFLVESAWNIKKKHDHHLLDLLRRTFASRKRLLFSLWCGLLDLWFMGPTTQLNLFNTLRALVQESGIINAKIVHHSYFLPQCLAGYWGRSNQLFVDITSVWFSKFILFYLVLTDGSWRGI